MKKLKLKKNKEINILRKHPWIFSGALMEHQELPSDGDLVYIEDDKSNIMGFGHFHNGSIAVKILSFGPESYTEAFWLHRMQKAYILRQQLQLENSHTNCYRWIHGEGDYLPGLIVDVFADYVVIQCHTIGMHRNLHHIVDAIKYIMGDRLAGIIDKSKESLPLEYARSISNQIVFGVESEIISLENGYHFKVDCLSGQKTGFFLDQRINRKLLSQYVKNKNILNAFCYSGGFSIYALANDSNHVVSLDVSKKALELLEQNIVLNALQSRSHDTVCADIHEYLKTMEDSAFDLIILDPPAFAKSVAKRHSAVQAYKRINVLAMKKIAAKGLLFSFSCSQVVDEHLFYNTIVSAGIESQRNIRVLHKLSQGPDHPVSLFHPEGSYLKGLVVYVE
jgi:23S rRNA (cytosine1962-C5)-methyltransferase